VLRDERGQAIVLFVISFTALMGLLALVVNVGNWLQAQRHLRTVADATAMEAAQSDHDTSMQIGGDAITAAQNMATANWEGSVLTQYESTPEDGVKWRGPDKTWLEITVTTQHEVGYLAQNMLAFLGVELTPLTFSSTAETTIKSPVALKQVAPIAIVCGRPEEADCRKPWPGWAGSPSPGGRIWRSFDGTDDLGAEIPFEFGDSTQIELRYRPDPANLRNSSWMPVQRFPGATELDVQNAIQSCDPSDIDSPSCDQTEISTPSKQVAMDYAGADAIYEALNNHGDWPYLVPVYDTYSPGAFPGDPLTPGEIDIVGFAAFTIEDVEQPNGPGLGPIVVRGTFDKMFFHLAQTPAGGVDDQGGEYDFGVRTIALSG
jgi:Flp pilus assembly protein TadG